MYNYEEKFNVKMLPDAVKQPQNIQEFSKQEELADRFENCKYNKRYTKQIRETIDKMNSEEITEKNWFSSIKIENKQNSNPIIETPLGKLYYGSHDLR